MFKEGFAAKPAELNCKLNDIFHVCGAKRGICSLLSNTVHRFEVFRGAEGQYVGNNKFVTHLFEIIISTGSLFHREKRG